ncbi:MAG: diacylglyceryl transferase [Pseudomonadota bacterium]|jgi:phosphatidylglycerol:prolipoprotein diacylglycerol transferase
MLVHPTIDPVALKLGPVAIHWYGLMYVVAFMAFLMLGKVRTRSPAGSAAGWTEMHLDSLLTYGVLGVIMGGRLGYVCFYKPAYYFAHPLEVFAVWQGGMSFHGGFLGVLAAMALFAWRHQTQELGKMNFWKVTDFIAPLVPLGLAAGRLGNFINAELPGRVADASLPWAMIFPTVDSLPRHPSQIYQLLLEGLTLFIILWLFSRKKRPERQVSAVFLLGYGLFRFMAEYFREPDAHLGILDFGMTMGQWLSLPMIIIGGVLFWLSGREQTGSARKQDKPHQ